MPLASKAKPWYLSPGHNAKDEGGEKPGFRQRMVVTWPQLRQAQRSVALHAAVEGRHGHNFPAVVAELGHVLVSLGAFAACHRGCWVKVENLPARRNKIL